jgi:flagella basal body P-ring formation protein FlgA
VLLAYARPVQAATFDVREQQVLDLIIQEVTQRNQIQRKDVEVVWLGTRLSSMVDAVPEGQVTLEIPSTARLIGTGSVPVQILIDGKKFRTIFPRVAIKVYQKVLVAKALIPQGAQPMSTDVALDRVAVDSNVFGQPLTSLDALAGAQATRNIQAGTVLTQQMFKIPPVVKMGAVVAVTLLCGDLTLITSAEARSNGAVGQLIKVMNLDSKREFTARVVGPDRVEVKLEE